MSDLIPDFLPCQLTLQRGVPGDYLDLEQFHYVARRPATYADVWSIRCCDAGTPSRVIAVGVLSYPVPSCHARETVLNRRHFTRRENLVFANQHIRTISRVVVHPQFRALGLSTALVRCLCAHCDTRYVEAIAMMARAHPFFERAGMRRVETDSEDHPIYFILDRESTSESLHPDAGV